MLQVLHAGALSHVLVTFTSPTAVGPFFLTIHHNSGSDDKREKKRLKRVFIHFFLSRILWYIIFFSGEWNSTDVEK